MKMLVLPRDPNPYQGLLYGAMGRLGVRIRYLGELTPSHAVNMLLLPAELAWHRMVLSRAGQLTTGSDLAPVADVVTPIPRAAS